MKGRLERRYHVERIHWNETREPVEDSCFVLRPERDAYARQALAAYADACQAENPSLAADLRDWLLVLAEVSLHSGRRETK